MINYLNLGNTFINYVLQKEENQIPADAGPVITISREYGSDATIIAATLAIALKERTGNDWKYITKEILNQAARELNSEELNIAHIFGAVERGAIDKLVVALSKENYPTDDEIKEKIASVVKRYAVDGNTILVGRAGCVIAKQIPNSLHIKIIAPFEYRYKSIGRRLGLSDADAKEDVLGTQKQRRRFMEFYSGNLPDSELYDAIFSRVKVSTEGIVKSIIQLAEYRELI